MKKSSTSSFRNKASNVLNIPGTKVSVTNAQLLTSTGSSTLDFFLGGGLAIGTICAIEEDQYNSYASLLMKYYLAEGATRKHSLFLAGGDKDPRAFLKELPAAKSVETSSNKKHTSDEQFDPSKLAKLPKDQPLKDGPPGPRNIEYCSEPGEPYDPVKIALRLLGQDSRLEPPAPRSAESGSDTKFYSDEPYDPIKIAMGLLGQTSGIGPSVTRSVPFCSGTMPTAEPSATRSVQCCSEIAAEPYNPLKKALGLLGQTSETSKCCSSPDSEDSLKIAWRYKSQNVEDAIKAESHNMSFDLTKAMPYEEIENCSVSTWVPTDCNPNGLQTSFLKMPYLDLLQNIRTDVESQGLKTSAKSTETILRIGINSIASPLWRTDNIEDDEQNLLRFLFSLKAYLRTSFAVAVITVPSFLLSNLTLISRIRQTCDTVIALESFVGSDKMSNPLFKDFDGLLHIRKLPVLNTFTYPSMPEDLAFKLKKRGLLIEPLHLPPELGDPTPQQQGQFSCSGLGKKLDF